MSNRDAVSHALDMIHTAHFRSLPREEQIDEVLGMLKVVDFKCPAVMYHGPGHQSSTRCERRDPHELTDEHFALNPMEPGFTWYSAEEYA